MAELHDFFQNSNSPIPLVKVNVESTDILESSNQIETVVSRLLVIEFMIQHCCLSLSSIRVEPSFKSINFNGKFVERQGQSLHSKIGGEIGPGDPASHGRLIVAVLESINASDRVRRGHVSSGI